ncbi:MAG: hypothetical protein U0736_24275 [Gemmataceae bacterium]
MTTVNADSTLLSYLAPLKEETLIRDSEGRLLGRFIPCGLTDEEVYARAGALLNIEEAKRRKVDERGQGKPLSAILPHC